MTGPYHCHADLISLLGWFFLEAAREGLFKSGCGKFFGWERKVWGACPMS